MKRILVLLVCLGNIAIAQQRLDYSDYEVVFHEEFDYPDPNKVYPSHRFKHLNGRVAASGTTKGSYFSEVWRITNGNWGAQNEFYTPEQTYLSAPGVIRMETKSVPEFTVDNGRKVNFHAGYLNLQPKPEYGNDGDGIVEARIKFPDMTRGTSPISFWLWGWNKTEIDVFDVSYKNYYITRILDWSMEPIQIEDSVAYPDLSPGFHIYTMVWTPSVVRYYIDGNLVNAIEYTRVRTFPFAYAVELSIMPITGQPGGQFMEVDWVKIWKPKCKEENLLVSSARGEEVFLNEFPVKGRMFQYEEVDIRPDSGVLRLPGRVPTIVEARSTRIEGNFEADQSVRRTSQKKLNDTEHTHVDNAYLEIRARPCGDVAVDGER